MQMLLLDTIERDVTMSQFYVLIEEIQDVLLNNDTSFSIYTITV